MGVAGSEEASQYIHTWMYMPITEELAQMGVLMGWFSEWDKRACISKKFPNELIISAPGPH